MILLQSLAWAVDMHFEVRLQRGLVCKSRDLVSGMSKLPLHARLTFLMPSGSRCKATSFSGLTTGILRIMLHIIMQVEEERVPPE
jgi:hypothetical protein